MAEASVVQVGRSGIRTGDPALRARVRAEFDDRHLVRLPAFLEPDLLERLAAQMERATWVERRHNGEDEHEWAADLKVDDAFSSTVMFLLNDSSLFEEIDALTGCGPFSCFVPNVYKVDPAEGHYDSWHDDVARGGRVALSINLGRTAYEGGALQVRRKQTTTILHEIRNSRFGDALLLRIAPDLEHYLTPVTGSVPRVAAAGWFQAAPSYPELLRRLAAKG